MKRILLIIPVCCIALLVCCSPLFLLFLASVQTHSTNIEEYGTFDYCVQEWETDFFPQLDKNIMSNFIYSYHADCGIDCAHEIYLEFTIENEDAFRKFVTENQNRILQNNETAFVQTSKYDDEYTEVVIEDMIQTRTYEDQLVIDSASIRKLMYNQTSHSVIFVHLYVIDYARFENYKYIDRFHIDPKELPINNNR